MKKKNSMLITISVLAVVIIGLIITILLTQNQVKESGSQDLSDMYSSIPTLGDESAKVHIVEFGDYKCPFCANFNSAVVPHILEEYVNTNKVQFHFMNYTFIGVDSTYIAEFAESVRQEISEEAYWQFHDLVYANQGDESQIWGTEENMSYLLSSFANEEEVDKVVKAVKKGKYEDYVKNEQKIVKKLQINSTPTIVIDGEPITINSDEDLINAIEDAIEKHNK